MSPVQFTLKVLRWEDLHRPRLGRLKMNSAKINFRNPCQRTGRFVLRLKPLAFEIESFANVQETDLMPAGHVMIKRVIAGASLTSWDPFQFQLVTNCNQLRSGRSEFRACLW
jgi:hypothetical protein